jgi:hypothetical protein
VLCPVCETRQKLPGDWCTACGAYLGLLRRQPRRIVRCVCASIGLGLALFFALAWQVFAPLLRGWPAADPGPLFWCGFVLGTLFLALGLAARSQLAGTWRRLLRTSGR